jgi:hypothetical protein
MKNLALILCLVAGLSAADPVDPAATYHNEAAKAKESFDAAQAKSNATAIKALTSLAQSAAKKGDIGEAAAAWKEVLRFDRENADARAFFTATGNLDQVLADTASPRPVPAPGAAGVKMPTNAMSVTLSPAPGSEKRFGATKAGTTVLFQYVSGTWSRRRNGEMLMASPDEPETDSTVRLAILDCSTQPATVLASVPAGTATKPFSFQLTADIAQLAIGIFPDQRQPPRPTNGSVVYKVVLKKP